VLTTDLPLGGSRYLRMFGSVCYADRALRVDPSSARTTLTIVIISPALALRPALAGSRTLYHASFPTTSSVPRPNHLLDSKSSLGTKCLIYCMHLITINNPQWAAQQRHSDWKGHASLGPTSLPRNNPGGFSSRRSKDSLALITWMTRRQTGHPSRNYTIATLYAAGMSGLDVYPLKAAALVQTGTAAGGLRVT
jgi:hypothetical protein